MKKPGSKLSHFQKLGKWLELHLQDPDLLRITTLVMMTVLGLGAVGVPMYLKISDLQEELAQEQERNRLIRDYSKAKKMLRKYRKHTPREADLDWWIATILDISRKANLKVVEFKPLKVKGKQARAGALQGTLLKFDLRGPYQNVVDFIGRLEHSSDNVAISRVLLQRVSEVAKMKTSITIGVFHRKKRKEKANAT